MKERKLNSEHIIIIIINWTRDKSIFELIFSFFRLKKNREKSEKKNQRKKEKKQNIKEK